MKPEQYLVYEALNPANGKRYVGYTVQSLADRRSRHVRDARDLSETKFHRALRKYGDSSFQWQVLAVLPTRGEAQIAERIEIACTRPEYNMTPGGDGCAYMKGRKHSPETRAHISAMNRLRKGEKRKGRKPCTDETRARLSAAAKRVNSVQYAQRYSQTAESVAKRAASNRGQKRTPEQRDRMQAAAKLSAASRVPKPVTVETRERLRQAATLNWAQRKGLCDFF